MIDLKSGSKTNRISDGARTALEPQPDWFRKALAIEPERTSVAVEGVALELLAWGKRGKPGLLLLHGNGAHADWWRFIAPFFAAEWRVGALSWSGMGRSGWHSDYSIERHGRELLVAAEALGLFDAPVRPQIVAHSFGAAVAVQVAAGADGSRFGGLMMVDNGARPAETAAGIERKPWQNPGYSTLDEGIARFRLRPEQACDNAFILRFIAERSLCLRDDGRWHWCFDPAADPIRGSIRMYDSAAAIAQARCPIDFVWGEYSSIMSEEMIAATRRVAPAGSRLVEIPDAAHHLMLDQPLALISAVRCLLQRSRGPIV